MSPRFLRRPKNDGTRPPSGHLEPLPAAPPPDEAAATTAPNPVPAPAPSPAGPPSPPSPPRPPAGSAEALPPFSLPAPGGRRAPAAPGPPRLAARFPTATAALVFAGQLHPADDLRNARCLRGDSAWWVPMDLGLEAARDAALSCGGQVHVEVGGLLVPDRGWGDPPASGTGPALAALTAASLLDLVRTAGLSRRPPTPVTAVTLLLPGAHLPGTVRRSLDLGLTVTYQRAGLRPLFANGPGRPAYAVTLAAATGEIPAALITALEDDPFVVVCRRVSERLLVQHRHESPLADGALSALVDEDAWVLAADGHGCLRLVLHGEPQPGTAFVRLGTDLPLADPPPDGWPDVIPEPPELTVVPARTRGLPVDAVLLTDEALAALPMVLEGHPLAETALLVRGRDRHLLTAPGGLLEDVPVGEALYCAGPGQFFLPLGHRLRPRLPAAARGALLPAADGRAVVMTPRECLGFDLATAVPVWTLWAGPAPEVDPQLPAAVTGLLHEIDRDLVPAPRTSKREPRDPSPRPSRARSAPVRDLRRTPRRAPSWQEEAYALEVAGELKRAAELHSRNNQPLQAARLYERAAEEPGL